MIEYIACVLMVDDKEEIHRLLRTSMSGTEYADLQFSSDENVLATFTVNRSDRIALNLELANGKEVTLAGQMREKGKIPVILLAVHDQERSIQPLPSVEADGQSIPSGFHVEQDGHLANGDSILDGQVFRIGELTIDTARRVVRIGKRPVHLTPTEYDLLCLLAAQAGTVLSHEELMQSIWHAKDAHTVHLLRVNISNLRRKLERNPALPTYLTTEPGIGYRLSSGL